MKESTLETLEVLTKWVTPRTTYRLLLAKKNNSRAGFIREAERYRTAEKIDWEYIYDNWERPRDRA